MPVFVRPEHLWRLACQGVREGISIFPLSRYFLGRPLASCKEHGRRHMKSLTQPLDVVSVQPAFRGRPCPSLDTLPPQGGSLCLGEQPEGRLEPSDPEEKISGNSQEALGPGTLVPQLFCRKLRRRSYRRDSPIHRTAKDPTLTYTVSISKPLKAQYLRTALPSAHSFPALKGEVCRASDQRQRDCAKSSEAAEGWTMIFAA